MKHEYGGKILLQAQDLADLIGLLHHNRLGGDFTRHLDNSVRPNYRRLVKPIRHER
jgi:hypothetical protein